jgi:hypothetical protein
MHRVSVSGIGIKVRKPTGAIRMKLGVGEIFKARIRPGSALEIAQKILKNVSLVRTTVESMGTLANAVRRDPLPFS